MFLAGISITLLAVAGCTSAPRNAPRGMGTSVHATSTEDGKLAGFTQAELLKEYRGYLFDDFLPSMDKYVIDHEYGGFMCNTDACGRNITTDKSLWYIGRGLWVYSFLYNRLDKNPKYLEVARKCVEFLWKNRPRDDIRWPSTFKRDGTIIEGPYSEIYGDLFLANGLAEYSKAAKDDLYWYMAKDILLKCLRIYDGENYRSSEKGIKAARINGQWMVILHLATQLLEYKEDAELEVVAGRAVDAIMNYHYNPSFGLINEELNHDLSRPEGPVSQFVYLGHDIEVLWMVMAEATRKHDEKLFDLAAERFKRHVEVAWDDVYGGVFCSLEDVDKNIWGNPQKALWAQEEVLIGMMMIIERRGYPWAQDWFGKVYRYVVENYPLAKHGYESSFWICYADRKVAFKKEDFTRVENYHHPRHLMLNILSLERMLEKR